MIFIFSKEHEHGHHHGHHHKHHEDHKHGHEEHHGHKHGHHHKGYGEHEEHEEHDFNEGGYNFDATENREAFSFPGNPVVQTNDEIGLLDIQKHEISTQERLPIVAV